MSAGELQQRRLPDRDLGASLGEAFGLGAPEQMWRLRKYPAYGAWGLLLGFFVGLPLAITAAGVAAGSGALSTKLILASLAGGLALACTLMVMISIRRAPVRARLFLYAGGLIELTPGEPEPRVARWADVTEFTVRYYESDEVAVRLEGFALRTDGGIRMYGPPGPGRAARLRALVSQADQALTPRLVPAMTEALASGTPVDFGKVRVTADGVIVRGHSGPGELAAWREMLSIRMTYLRRGDCAHEIVITSKEGPADRISISGLPNGLFLPHVLAYAAARHEVPLTGYRPAGRGETGAAVAG